MMQNKLAEHKTFAEKETAYRRACLNSTNQVMAYHSDGGKEPLINVDVSRVEYIGGLWRVQNPMPRNIQTVRGCLFVLDAKLPRSESNHFEFYRAYRVATNCYGPIISDVPMIVAKYVTDKNTYWSYGNTLEQARAFLGIKLYDEYQDLIHSVACASQKTHQKK